MLLCRCDVTEISFFTPVYASPLLKCNRSAFDFRRDFRSQLSFLSLPPAGSFSSISLNKHKMKVMTNVNRMLSSEMSLKIEVNLWMEGKVSSAKLDAKHKNKLFSQPEKGPQVWRILSLCAGTNTLVQLNGDITVDSSVHGNIPTVRIRRRIARRIFTAPAAAETYVPAYRTPHEDIYSGAATGIAKTQAAHNPL